MPPIELRAETIQGQEIAKTKIPEEPGVYELGGFRVEVTKVRRNGRGPNGPTKGIRAKIRPLFDTTRTINFDGNKEATIKLPQQPLIKAKLVK